MRKLFALILSFLLIISTCSVSVLANDTPVAKVGDTEYTTIDEAIVAWTNGKTLTLLSDVTLTDVIKLSSTEYHILDLGTYTMTAAKNKDAIQYVINGRATLGYALDIKADATNPGGITATGKAIVSHTKPLISAPSKDRPITRFYGGVFNATNVVKQGGTFGSGYTGSNAPGFQFYGGEYNGAIYTNRSQNQFYGGTFNGSMQMSVDSSAYTLVAGGTFANLSNSMMRSELNKDKFTIGSAKGVYDREVYIDDNGNMVIAAAEPTQGVEAAVATTPDTTLDYLAYSKVATEGALNYTDVYMALEKNNTSSAKVTIYVDELDLAGIDYKGTIVAPEGETLNIINAPEGLKTEGNVVIVKEGLAGSGTETDPYQIGSVDDLILLRDSVNAGETDYNAPDVYVALVADIDMAGATWERGIGDGINATFDGIFDGKNFTIKNLNFAPEADSDGYFCGGLFGYTYGAVEIKNLVLENINVTANGEGHNVGALVGFANNNGGMLTVSNVTVKNLTIDATGAYGVGAIVGYSYRDMGTIENCTVDGATIKGYSFVGGITGYSYSNATITGCTVKNVTITATSKGAGGIAGLVLGGSEVTDNTISDTVVTAPTNWGYVVGEVASEGIIVENNIAAEPQVGGSYSSGEAVQAKIGSKYYTTFDAAYKAAKNGETVTLLTPITVSAGESLTLDKDVTITYTSNIKGEDMITNRGTLIIDGTTLIYNNTDTTGSNVTVSTISSEPGSVLEVKSGVVKNDSANNGAIGIYAYAIDILTNGSLGDVSVIISGGEVISTNYMAIRQFNNGTVCKNSLTVTGGEIYGAKRAIQIHMDNNAAYLDISGGTIEAGEDGYALCLFPTAAENISVTDGTFIGSVYSGTNGFICGGTFDEAVYSDYVVEDFEVVDNGDGTFGVVEKTEEPVATVDGVEYYDLQEAINAANNGSVVSLLKNIEITSTLKVNADKKLTLDLNGFVIDGTEKVRIALMSYGDLILKDSSAEQTGVIKAGIGTAGNAVNVTGGTFTMESGSIYSLNNALLIDENASTVNIKGGKLTTEPTTNNSSVMYISGTNANVINITGGEMVGFNGILLWNNTEINISGGSITAQSGPGIQGNGSRDNTEINIIGGSIFGAEVGIYHPQGGKLNISGDTIVSGATGIVVKGGQVNISGGSIIATGAADTYAPVNSGFKGTGDALYVEHYDNSPNSENYGTPTVTITGGNFNSVNGKAVGNYANPNNNVEALTGYITGGTFSNDVSDLCADGLEATENDDGTFSIVEKEEVAQDPYKVFYIIDMVPETDANGNTYYRVGFAAGIDSLKYKAVGFDIVAENGAALEIKTTQVYDLFYIYNIDGSLNMIVEPSMLGGNYIFYQELLFPSSYDNMTITFRPFYVTLSGEKVSFNKSYDISDFYTSTAKGA